MGSKKRRPRSKGSAKPQRPAAGTASGGSPVEPFPAEADTSVSGLLAGTKRLVARALVPMALVTTVVQIPLVVALFAGLSPKAALAYDFVSLIGIGASVHVCLERAEARSPGVLESLWVGVKNWFGMFAAWLFGSLMILVLGLLLIVPGVLRWLSYAVVFPVIIAGEEDGVAALALSSVRMKGRRSSAFVVLLIASLGPLAVTLCTSVFDGTLAMMLAETPWADALSLPALSVSGLATVHALRALVDPIAYLPMTIISVVLYRRTRHISLR